MNDKTFVYKTYKPGKEGEEPKQIIGGVFMDEINTWVVDEDKLYLFLKKEIEDIQPKEVWSETKKTKDNPSGWTKKIQMRTVKEPVTLKVEDKEDIDKFLNYVNQQSI